MWRDKAVVARARGMVGGIARVKEGVSLQRRRTYRCRHRASAYRVPRWTSLYLKICLPRTFTCTDNTITLHAQRALRAVMTHGWQANSA